MLKPKHRVQSTPLNTVISNFMDCSDKGMQNLALLQEQMQAAMTPLRKPCFVFWHNFNPLQFQYAVRVDKSRLVFLPFYH